MEPWPAVAWVLLLTVILDLLKTTYTRDFTDKDIIYLHPSTTPFPGGFKCFTCEDTQDNFECNRWAPDVYCPRVAKYCYTRHTMDRDGESVSVTKRCVAVEDCLSTGCTEMDHEGNTSTHDRRERLMKELSELPRLEELKDDLKPPAKMIHPIPNTPNPPRSTLSPVLALVLRSLIWRVQ